MYNNFWDRLKRWWYETHIFRLCCDCGRPYLVLGFLVGKHDNCIPF